MTNVLKRQVEKSVAIQITSLECQPARRAMDPHPPLACHATPAPLDPGAPPARSRIPVPPTPFKAWAAPRRGRGFGPKQDRRPWGQGKAYV
ncbi:hypothetical protein MASR1M32_10460 [Rhodobacter sp.]